MGLFEWRLGNAIPINFNLDFKGSAFSHIRQLNNGPAKSFIGECDDDWDGNSLAVILEGDLSGKALILPQLRIYYNTAPHERFVYQIYIQIRIEFSISIVVKWDV